MKINCINQLLENLKEAKCILFFKHNIWQADIADIQLISKYNKGIRFSLCVIDLFSRYAWVVPLKYKKGITIVNAFQSILDSTNKMWVD